MCDHLENRYSGNQTSLAILKMNGRLDLKHNKCPYILDCERLQIPSYEIIMSKEIIAGSKYKTPKN